MNSIVFNGIKIFASEYVTKSVQTQYPRCNKKKKRIVKKFAKKYTKQVPNTSIMYETPMEVIMHPIAMDYLKRELTEQRSKRTPTSMSLKRSPGHCIGQAIVQKPVCVT